MRKIQYRITFLGETEVFDNYTDEQIEIVIGMECLELGCDISVANDVEWEEV